jgi:hypothetical protein
MTYWESIILYFCFGYILAKITTGILDGIMK